MRILHWYPNFLGGGGVANAVKGLAEAQETLGAEVAIASAEADGIPLYEEMRLSEQVQVIRWKPRWVIRKGGLVLRSVPEKAWEEMRSFGADVVHIHGEFNPANLFVPRHLPAPLILSPHGAFHPVVLKKSRRWAKRLYIQWARRALYARVGYFHALSPMEAEHIQTLLPNSKVYCVPQGPNPNTANLDDRLMSSSKPPEDRKNSFRFLFVGRLDVYTKGLDIFLEAFAEVVKAMPDRALELWLIGPDWHGGLQRLQAKAKEFGCDDKVMFTGPLAGKEVWSFLCESDVYVHLSRHEGFPLSIVEALWAGKPVILSCEIGTTSYKEVFSLPHVRVVPPKVGDAAQAMKECVEDSANLGAMAQSYAPRIRRFFSWEEVAKRHLEEYERLRRASV